MKNKKLNKRIISLGLTILMLLGVVIGHLPGGIFGEWFMAADYSLEQSELALGTNVIPNQLKNNDGFMSKYIYTTKSDALNLNSNFKLSSWSNIDSDIPMKKGNTLTRSKLMHQKNQAWEAVYEWSDMSDKQVSLIEDSSYVLVYEGNLFADYHYHLINHTSKKWDVGTAWLYRGSYSSITNNNNIWKLTAESKDDEKAQAVVKELETTTMSSYGINSLAFRAEHDGCACGSSGVSNSIFYMYDKSVPYVEDAYICRNSDGSGKLSSGDGFVANEKGYVVLDFNEKIRFSDNEGKILKLNLEAYYCKNNTSVEDSIIYAELISLKDDKLIFRFTVPEKTGNELTDVYINGISSQQEFVGSSSGFPLTIYKGDGSVAIDTNGGYTVSNYITDLAGNPMDWTISDKSLNKIYLDNVNPTLTGISMSGSMINETSTTSKDSWSEDIDRGSVFAGVGDTIAYTVDFSESITGYTQSEVKAILNIKGADGNYIELGLDREWSDSFKFQSLTITADMVANNYGKPIVITGFKGLENLKDKFGNEMEDNLTSISKAPAQQIYLDVDAPVISTPMASDAGGTVYTPYADEEGEYFTFPIKITENLSKTTIDNTSTITGKVAYFSLLMNGNKNFEWYVDTNQAIDKNVTWNSGTTALTAAEAGKCSFNPVDGTTYYIHIKLDKNTDYDYATNLKNLGNIYFVGSIYVEVQDYAGNFANKTFDIQHKVDTEVPTGSVSNQAILTIDYDSKNATLTADIHLKDNYALKSLKYRWRYTPYVMQDGSLVSGEMVEGPLEEKSLETGTLFENYDTTTSYTFSFNESENTGRKGQAVLIVDYVDWSGRTGTVVSDIYEYDFTKSIPNYTVNTGSQDNPLLLPEVVISAPTATDTSTEASATRTIFAFPYSKNEDGTYNYYIWDPLDYIQGDNTVEYTVNNIFEELKNDYPYGYVNGAYKYATTGAWSKVTGNLTKDGGTIRQADALSMMNPKEVYDFISCYYGKLEVLFITSSEFGINYNSLGDGHGYAYTNAKSTVETYTVYLDNNAEFEVKLADIQKDGKDATDGLNYITGKVPAKNIDNVALTFTITNMTDTEKGYTPGYDLVPLDISNCKAYLYYSGTSKGGTGELKYTWSLDRVNTQTLVIPEGVATDTGWYRVEVVLDTVDGEPVTTEMKNYFFMDAHVSDVQIHEYYKEYDHEDLYTYTTENKLIPKNHIDLEGSTYLDVALDTAPDGWTCDTYISFGREDRSDGWKDDIQELVKIRVYNKSDANYEENALWVNVADLSSKDRVKYTPKKVTEFKKDSYGTKEDLTLPLLAGDNLICYEIISTNGVVTSHEIAMYAYTEAIDLELDVEYTKISSRTGGLMEFTVSPVETPELDLSNSIFNFLVVTHAEPNATIFTFDYDINKEFYLLDQNGNLSTTHCVVTDVDGEEPGGWTSSISGLYDTTTTFSFNFEAYDAEGTISTDEIILTFDEYYSGLLMGLTGEERTNNTQKVSMKLPINLEKDADGNYLPWESYEDDNYGIYRTQLIYVGENAQYGYASEISVNIWGTWKYDKELENETSSETTRTLTLSTKDANGNEVSVARSYSGSCSTPRVSTGLYVNEEYEDGIYLGKGLDENGYVGIYFDRPLSVVNGYGVGELTEGYSLGQRERLFYTTAPMITKDGIYKFEVTDLFGDTYETELDLTGDYGIFGTIGIDVSFSETNDTNKDVTVTAEAMLENDYITSITAVTDSNEPIDGTIIEIEDMLPTNAIITMPENGKITIKTAQGKERVVTVSNIDKALEPASVIFVDSMGMEIDTTEETLYEKVTAMVVCDEVLYGTNGQLNHTFPIGSVKGDTYTFEYSDIAGNTGSITAKLPYTLENEPTAEPVKDEKAPDFILGLYGMRNDTYEFLGNISNPCDEKLENGSVDNSDAKEIGTALSKYISQKYKLMLNIEDDSDVKILVQEANSSAPTSYADVETGSAVEHVTLSGTSIIVEENTAFDIYAIDEMNNVTSLTNVVVDSIDNIALELEVKYEVIEDDNDETVVVATFEPKNPIEASAQIIALDESVLSKWMLVDVYDETVDEFIQKTVLRYYYLLSENGSYEFTYKDQYGNIGQTTATVKGLSNSPAVVNSVSWFGTTANMAPADSSLVNKDVVAAIKMSKAVSDVKLYVYKKGDSSTLDETCLGAALDANAPVKLSFTSNNVYITYEDNVDYQIIAQFTAAENGKKGYDVLPVVTCIDKVAPTVDLVESKVSDDKRSKTFVFNTSEATLFSKNNITKDDKPEYATTFEWITTTNTAQELIFTDKAGNNTRYQITSDLLSDVDTQYMSVSFSASADGANASNNPVKDLNVAVSKDIYVKVTKAADAYVNDVNVGTFAADTWTKVTLPQEAGLHILKLVDVNTGEILYKTIAAQPKDNVAPVITFDLSTIALEEVATVAEMEAAIRSGVTITDDKDGVITEYTVTGQPSTVVRGLYELTYTAEDEAGNKVTANRTLYIMQEGTPILKINGETAVPCGTTIIHDFDIKLEVEGLDTDLLTVKVKSGIKTVGQMKYGTTAVENMQFTVSEEGFYTIYIRTQDRVELITHIYVEE